MTYSEAEYYTRQLQLAEFGPEKQKTLAKSHVVVVGAGGLGCPALQYLAGAGVGKITIVDGDTVHISNLHRQILFSTNDIGLNKAKVAKERIEKGNPFIAVDVIETHLVAGNAHAIVNGADVVIDATDNFDSRTLLGAVTEALHIPLVFAAIYAFEGQLSVFNFENGPSFSDAFPKKILPGAVPNCAVNGVVGFVPGIFGVLQAAEAIKVLVNDVHVMSGKIMVMNVLTLKNHFYKIAAKAIKTETNNSNTMVSDNKAIQEITPRELYARLQTNREELYLVDVREIGEWNEFNIGGELIPLKEIPGKAGEIPTGKDIVVICRSGARSLHAAQFLSNNYVFKNIFNLKGGLLSWRSELGSLSV